MEETGGTVESSLVELWLLSGCPVNEGTLVGCSK